MASPIYGPGPNAGGASGADTGPAPGGTYDISTILPVLISVLGNRSTAAPGGAGGAKPRAGSIDPNSGMHVPIGPEFTQSMKTRKGQLTAGIASVLGNVLIANKNMGNPLGVPWWLGGDRQPAPTQAGMDTRNPSMGRSPHLQSAPPPEAMAAPPPSADSGGGGMMGGLDIGKLLTSVIGGGGGGGGALGGILGGLLG